MSDVGPSPAQDSLPASELCELDQICTRFEDALKADRQPLIEAFLEQAPEAIRGNVLGELLHLEFEYARRRGTGISTEGYLSRFPQYRTIVLNALRQESSGKDQSTSATMHQDAAPRLEPPEVRRLGEFTILRELGRGGMGVVYEAVQEPLGRHVALKVLPAHGLLKGQFLERFQREARAAARLHHTNIVPVYGVGECEGTHYYAMQFIAGRNLDVILRSLRRPGKALVSGPTMAARPSLAEPVESRDSSPTTKSSLERTGADAIEAAMAVAVPASAGEASTARREILATNIGPAASAGSTSGYFQQVAEIGRQVADALAYAHRQGILHRDIKPSNLMLDSQGTVWVTDFGLAKAEGAEDITRTGDILGTLQYMAPERFEGISERSSDIYALGLTLYEMLTLRPAFTATNRLQLIESIQNKEPVRPRQIDGRIPRDLETIVLKAGAKAATVRYGAAEELADDLRRFIENRPIQARRVGAFERLWRWSKRNPDTAAAVAGLFLFLVTTVIALATGLWAVDRERRQTAAALERESEALTAETAALEKEKEAKKVTYATLEKMTGNLVEEWLGRQTNFTEKQEEYLRESLKLYESFTHDLDDTPQGRYGVAKAYLRVGRLQSQLGNHQESEKALRKAGQMFQQLIAEYPGEVAYRQGLASSQSDLAIPLHNLGRLREAADTVQDGLATYRQLVADSPGDWRFQEDLARAHNNLGNELRNLGKLREAENAYRDAVALQRKAAAEFPEQDQFNSELARSLDLLGALLTRTGRAKEAETLLREALSLRRRLATKAVKRPDLLEDLVTSLFHLGRLLRDTGQMPGAEIVMRDGLQLSRKLAADYPNRPKLRHMLSNALDDMGTLLKNMKRRQEAERCLREALAVSKQLVADFPRQAEYRERLAAGYYALGNVLKPSGESAEAENAFRKAIELLQDLVAQYHERAQFRRQLAAAQGNLGLYFASSSRWQDAESIQRESLTTWKQLAADFPTVSDVQNDTARSFVDLAILLQQRKEHAQALKLLEQARPHHQAALKANPKNPRYRRALSRNLHTLAQTLTSLGDHVASSAASEELVTLGGDLQVDAYNAASNHARCATIAANDSKLSARERQTQAEKYAYRAVEHLRQAINSGFKDAGKLEQDRSLDILRSRTDFKELQSVLVKAGGGSATTVPNPKRVTNGKLPRK